MRPIRCDWRLVDLLWWLQCPFSGFLLGVLSVTRGVRSLGESFTFEFVIVHAGKQQPRVIVAFRESLQA